jgi:hypothetical protein
MSSVPELEPDRLRMRGPPSPSGISVKLRSLRLLLLLGVVPLCPRVAPAGLTEIDAVARLPAERLDLGGEGGVTRTALTGNNFQHCAAPFCSFGRNTGNDASFRDAAKKTPPMKPGHAWL